MLLNIIDIIFLIICLKHGFPYQRSAVPLERCFKRLEWERVRDKEKKEADDEAEKERNAMQAIDW